MQDLPEVRRQVAGRGMKVDVGWRAGYDNRQHIVLVDNPRGRAFCGVYVKPIRYDRPDWDRCKTCLKWQS